MAISFPANPVAGQEYAFGNKLWRFNGVAWDAQPLPAVADAWKEAVGSLPALETADKSDLVGAINEVHGQVELLAETVDEGVNGLDGKIGQLEELSTVDKTSLVRALNEVNAKPSGSGTTALPPNFSFNSLLTPGKFYGDSTSADGPNPGNSSSYAVDVELIVVGEPSLILVFQTAKDGVNIWTRPVMAFDDVVNPSPWTMVKQTGKAEVMYGNTINFGYESVEMTITADTAFHTYGAPPSGQVGVVVMDLINAGAFTLTFPAGSKWAGGVKPTFTASGRDKVAVMTDDGGATLDWMLLAKDIK
jgi:hypothetical protein